MRTYRLLAEKARQFAEDEEIQAALRDAGAPGLGLPTVGAYSRDNAERLRAEPFDLASLRARGYRNERLDQLVTELIVGAR
jgi:xylose isomerase